NPALPSRIRGWEVRIAYPRTRRNHARSPLLFTGELRHRGGEALSSSVHRGTVELRRARRESGSRFMTSTSGTADRSFSRTRSLAVVIAARTDPRLTSGGVVSEDGLHEAGDPVLLQGGAGRGGALLGQLAHQGEDLR